MKNAQDRKQERDIYRTAAQAFTTPRLADDLKRLAAGEKGWKKVHQEALMLEAAMRLENMHHKLGDIRIAVRDYDAALKGRRDGVAAAQKLANELLSLFENN